MCNFFCATFFFCQIVFVCILRLTIECLDEWVCRWKMKVNEAGRRAGAVGKGLFRLISSSRDREIGTRGHKSVVKNETLKPR